VTASASDVALRRARSADLDEIAALWRSLLALHAELDPALRVAGDALPARALAQLVDGAGTAAWVAEAEARVVGFCAARVEDAPRALSELRRAEITELFVAADARRSGFGSALVAAACEWARERGAARVEVRVVARNPAGQAFWRKLGFGAFVDVLDRRL
jgi:ribosomal protein S18 acetylase RimI-like enzyme